MHFYLTLFHHKHDIFNSDYLSLITLCSGGLFEYLDFTSVMVIVGYNSHRLFVRTQMCKRYSILFIFLLPPSICVYLILDNWEISSLNSFTIKPILRCFSPLKVLFVHCWVLRMKLATDCALLVLWFVISHCMHILIYQFCLFCYCKVS
jgi:hypothetical protein